MIILQDKIWFILFVTPRIDYVLHYLLNNKYIYKVHNLKIILYENSWVCNLYLRK